MQGNVSPLALAAVLRQVARRRQSGVLHVSSAERSVRVRLSAGSVAEASQAGAGGLRDYLTRTGRIDPSALERAVEANEEGLAVALVAAGAIDAEAMRDIVRERARESLLPLFGWSSGEYRFDEGEGSVEGGVPADLSALEAILEGTRSITDADLVRSSLGDSTARLRRSAAPDQDLDPARLSDSERSVLDLCGTPAGGDLPLDEVASACEQAREETLRCVHTLVAVGALELEPEGTEPGLQRTTVLPRVPGARTGPPTLVAGMVPERIGRYTVDEVLGWGSMGLVVSARDPEIDRSVAVKVIHSALHLDDAELESYETRFRQEAKAAGKLMHQGIVAVFDAGRNENGEPYLVMEHVEGETLKEKFGGRRATADECRELVGQVLDALSFAHGRGIIHRDLKPQNLIVTHDGLAKIMDFGVAHVVGSELTQDHEMLGSPAYMAPEQLSSLPVDGRTDLFALGVVLYWMLTARLPFEGDSLAAIITAILTKNPMPPGQLSASVPADLNDIVLRCLSKDPRRRFADAMEMKRALHGAAPSRPAPAARRPFWGALAAAALGAVMWAAFLGGRGESVRRVAPAEILPTPQPSVADAATEPPPQPGGAVASTLPEPQERVIPDAVIVPAPAPQMSRVERLYHDAGAAFESGDLEGSRASLDSLLEEEPDYPGASELLLSVNGETVRRTLPIELDAKHDHRFGSCDGRLTLADGRIEYTSEQHGTWRWAFDQIVSLESRDSFHLELKTGERDMLKLGGSKRFRFELAEPIDRETWSGFRTIANR